MGERFARKVGLLGMMVGLLMATVTASAAASPSLEAMVGQMLMIGFRGTTFEAKSPLGEAITEGNLGGVVLYGRDVALDKPMRNIRSAAQLQALTADLQDHARIPLFIAVDEEGGQVSRLAPRFGFPETVTAATWGRRNDPAWTRRGARAIGQRLRKLGCTINLAPVVDLNTNPDNPAIGKLERSFGANPDTVTRQAAAFIHGLHDAGILACIKHFPGHGSAYNDSHLGLTDISSTWSPKELAPYKRLVDRGLADAVMTAHVFHADLDPKVPATLSAEIIPEILRREIGYEGVVISDDLQMGAIRQSFSLRQTVRRCLEADVDIFLFGNNLEYEPFVWRRVQRIVRELVDQNIVSRSRIERSYERIQRLKKRMDLFQGRS